MFATGSIALHRSLIAVPLLLAVSGCAALGGAVNGGLGGGGLDRAEKMTLLAGPPKDTDLANAARDRVARNDYIEQWMGWSDVLCQDYKAKVIAVSRNERLTTDIASGILTGLATIFTKVGTVHPLAGAATIITGIGASASADTFAKETGDVIASAIETARHNQANQIEINLRDKNIDEYSLYRAERDVADYHGMCSIETALTQIKASLKQTSPDAGTTPPARQGDQVTGGQVVLSVASVAGHGVATTDSARILQQFIRAQDLTPAQRDQRSRKVEQAAKDLGFGDVLAQSFVRDDTQANLPKLDAVAKRLGLR